MLFMAALLSLVYSSIVAEISLTTKAPSFLARSSSSAMISTSRSWSRRSFPSNLRMSKRTGSMLPASTGEVGLSLEGAVLVGEDRPFGDDRKEGGLVGFRVA